MEKEIQYPKFSSEEIKPYINDKEIYIIDTREISSCKNGYLENSIIIPLSMSFSKWFPSLIKENSKVIIITDLEHQKDSLEKTSSFNSYKILGYSIYEEIKNNLNVGTIEYNSNTSEEIQKIIEDKKSIIDVREISEFKETGIIKDAILIPLSDFKNNFKKIPNGGEIYVYCTGGIRAIAGMTFAKREGYKNKFIIMEGGMMKTIKEGFPTVPYNG